MAWQPSRWVGWLMGGLILCAVGGCGTPPPSPEYDFARDNEEGIVDLIDPSTPIPPERFLKPDFARIAPGDQIHVKALSYEELDGTVTVAQDGRINLSLLGSVEAAGLTLQELDDELTQDYSAYFRNFDLAVILVESAPRHVYVLGQVKTGGGRYPFSPGDRVIHGLAMAGGMTDSARENSVILLRRDADGTDHAYRLDFSKIHHRLAPKDIFLQPGDVVYVPKSRFATFTDFAEDFLDIVQRSTVSALIIDDLFRRNRGSVSVGR